MLKWLRWSAAWGTPLLILLLVVVGAQSFRAPMPAERYEQCLQSSQKHHAKEANCKTDESLWERSLVDPVAYYTLWLTIFTGALAAIGVAQWMLIDKQIRLSRAEFNSAHRPRIIVRSFQLTDTDPGKEVGVIFVAQNVGDTTGTVIEVRSATLFLPPKDKLPTNFSFPFKESFNVPLASGERELFPANGSYARFHRDPLAGVVDSRALYCIGTLAYLDGGGTRRETGFCRRYFPIEDRWEPIESEYEYAY